MTRKEAVLILLLALLLLAGRQHIQWPSRFWESPSFEAINRDDIAKMLSRLKPVQEEEIAPLLVEDEPPTSELEPEPVKEASLVEADKPEPKKPTKKARRQKSSVAATKPEPEQAAPAGASQPPTPESVLISFSQYDKAVRERIGSCWEYANTGTQQGIIRVEFSHDRDGYLQDIRAITDTLQLPLVKRCVLESIKMMRFEQVDATMAGIALFETTITFKPSMDPS